MASLFSELPDLAMNCILKNLDFRSLCSLSQTNRRFQNICDRDEFWKPLYCSIWNVGGYDESMDLDISFKNCFALMFAKFGRYIDNYASIGNAWRRIENFLAHHSPNTRLNPGLTEEQIDSIEKILEIRFPNDFRCSLRFHDGESFTNYIRVPLPADLVEYPNLTEFGQYARQVCEPALLGILSYSLLSSLNFFIIRVEVIIYIYFLR